MFKSRGAQVFILDPDSATEYWDRVDNANSINLSWSRSAVSLTDIPGDDFPRLAGSVGELCSVSIAGVSKRSVINERLRVASDENSLLSLRIVAPNGYRYRARCAVTGFAWKGGNGGAGDYSFSLSGHARIEHTLATISSVGMPVEGAANPDAPYHKSWMNTLHTTTPTVVSVATNRDYVRLEGFAPSPGTDAEYTRYAAKAVKTGTYIQFDSQLCVVTADTTVDDTTNGRGNVYVEPRIRVALTGSSVIKLGRPVDFV